jgi:oligosaccharide repeat unit polymerase
MIDLIFYTLYFLYACAVGWVLFRFRREPLYDPRILFTLSASLWLFIIHGYLIDFEGYLAAKPGLYSQDIRVLSAFALGMMLVGYIAFIGGASLGVRFAFQSPSVTFRDYRLLMLVCVLLIFVAVLNFMANVVLISGGNVFRYLSEFALRTYQIADNQGVTASGYLLGFIGVQVIAFVVGRRESSRLVLLGLLAAVAVVFVIRFSQARIFQTLVLIGACYVSYSMGVAGREGRHTPWLQHFHYLVLAAGMGLGFYFLRLASALNHLGMQINWQTVSEFSDRIVHFAFERGNVPNFPIVFTIIDKMPAEEGFLYGKTLFNWAIFLIPKSILKGDYLISIWVKNTWYLNVEGGGLPPTAVGEWYANFGFAGVVVGMFLVGLALGTLYKMARTLESPYLAVLWANLVFGFVVIYPKTDLAQIPVFSIFILFWLWLLMKVLQSGARRQVE